MFVDDNQYVEKGYIIAEIDPKPYMIKLNQAEAKVELYRARLNEAVAAIDSLSSQINLTKARLKKAKWDFERAKKLFAAKTIYKNKYEVYLTDYRVL